MTLREIRKYERGLAKEVARIKQVMKETWGTAPDVDVEVDLRPVVTAAFNIKGFAHKGRKLFLNGASMAGYRKPNGAAKQIMAEIVDHRNTCGECGEHLPSIYYRLQHAQAILIKTGKMRNRAAPYADWRVRLLRNGFEFHYDYVVVGVDKDGRPKSQSMVLPLRPLDPVEAEIYPGRARVIAKALRLIEIYKRKHAADDDDYEGEGE